MKFKMNKHKLRLTFMAVFGMVNLRYSDFMNTVGCLFDMVVTRYILVHIFLGLSRSSILDITPTC